MHEGSHACHVFNQLGADGPPRQAPRRRLEFEPGAAVLLSTILRHCFKHMDRPFSVHSHNCQDFASELTDLVRLTGQTAAAPSQAAEPCTVAVAPTDAADATAAGSSPSTEFAFDVGDLRGETSAQQGSAVEAAEAVEAEAVAVAVAEVVVEVVEPAVQAAEVAVDPAVQTAEKAAEPVVQAAEEAAEPVVQAAEEAVQAKAEVVLAAEPLAATGTTDPDSTPEAAEEAGSEDGWEVVSGKSTT